MNKTATASDREFVISRVFDAPRDLVFKAFTEAERMQHWWGPKGFIVVKSAMDLRPGGFYHFCLKGPDGALMWGKFVYREIVAPERIVWINSFSDEARNVTHHPMSPTWPLEMLSTALFEEDGKARTKVTLKWSPHNSDEAGRATFAAGHASMNQGWSGTFEQLAAYLATARER
ncbi:MAG: SRPBCC family protein [Hyphomicrobiales bacterium]